MEPNKPKLSFSLNQVLVIILAILLTLFISEYLLSAWKEKVKIDSIKGIHSVTYTGKEFQTVKGKVTFLNLEPLRRDGSAEMTIQTTGGIQHDISISSGESSCDRDAITIPPDIVEGKTVEIKGIPENSKKLVICKKGTYIKSL